MQRAAQLLDQIAADGQPQSRALARVFGSVERLENPLEGIGQARPGVGEAKDQGAVDHAGIG